jgi:hypothetical protein
VAGDTRPVRIGNAGIGDHHDSPRMQEATEGLDRQQIGLDIAMVDHRECCKRVLPEDDRWSLEDDQQVLVRSGDD